MYMSFSHVADALDFVNVTEDSCHVSIVARGASVVSDHVRLSNSVAHVPSSSVVHDTF